MPNGLHLSDADFFRATISVPEYLTKLESYLERMLAFGATDEDSARRWFLQALTSLGYVDYATYEARVETDTRIINPSAAAPGVVTPAMQMPGLQLPSAQSLPYFKQVVAPIVYRKEAERKAVQFGYIDEEGTIVNETSYNTLLRNAIQDAEKYKYGFIQENLEYQKDLLEYEKEEARVAEDYEKFEKAQENIRKLNENIKKATEFQIKELGFQEGLVREEYKKQEREEAWAKQQEAARVGREFELAAAVPPTGEPAVREFLEEERPAGLQEFIRGKLPSVLEKFEREQAGARRAWWAAIQQPSYEEALREAEWEAERWTTVRAKGLEAGWKQELEQLEIAKGAPLVAQDVMPEQWAFQVAGQRMTEAYRRVQEFRELPPERAAAAYPMPTAEQMEDPLKRYLAQYPWAQEFLKLSPSQRGFAPSRFAPSARWFV